MTKKIGDLLRMLFFIFIALQIVPGIFNTLKKQYLYTFVPHTKVACISFNQVIKSSSEYVRNLQTYFEDSTIKAIVLRVESPGGAAGSSEAIAHEIERLKKKYPKPVIALSENICASGGYYIFVCADYLISSPSTLIGSVGTAIPYQFKLGKLLEHYNVDYESVTAGRYKSTTDPFERPNAEQKALLESVAQDSYKNFTEHIARHRTKLIGKETTLWADGKIFTGRQALSLGLIDAIGSWSEAIQKVKELTATPQDQKIEWVYPTPQRTFWSMFNHDEYGPDETMQPPFSLAQLLHIGELFFYQNHHVAADYPSFFVR